MSSWSRRVIRTQVIFAYWGFFQLQCGSKLCSESSKSWLCGYKEVSAVESHVSAHVLPDDLAPRTNSLRRWSYTASELSSVLRSCAQGRAPSPFCLLQIPLQWQRGLFHKYFGFTCYEKFMSVGFVWVSFLWIYVCYLNTLQGVRLSSHSQLQIFIICS